MPHLQRMAGMARQLRAAEGQVRSARAALDAARQPVLLVDRSGRVIHANATAETVLRAADGLSVSRDGLTAATSAATRTLKRLIAAAAGDRSHNEGGTRGLGIGGTARLPRPSGRPALAAIVIPVRGRGEFAAWDLAPWEDPVALLSISDPLLSHDTPPRLLMDLYRLTPAEAALASRLQAGEDLNMIAAATGRSVNTVRNLLARLMDKTETRRQAELVRLLESLPLVTGEN